MVLIDYSDVLFLYGITPSRRIGPIWISINPYQDTPIILIGNPNLILHPISLYSLSLSFLFLLSPTDRVVGLLSFRWSRREPIRESHHCHLPDLLPDRRGSPQLHLFLF